MKATLTGTPISAKKLNVIAGTVRRRSVTEALDMLKVMPKKGAKALHKVIHSAMANAEANDNQDRKNLVVDEVIVNKGVVLHRFRPVSRGRAHPYTKMTSNVKITLKAIAGETKKATKKAPKAEKSTPKKTAEKAETKKPTKSPKTTK